MVDNDEARVDGTEAVGLESVAFSLGHAVARTETHVAGNDIGAGESHGVVGHTDAVAGGCLSGEGEVAVGNLEVALQIYGA